MMNLQREKIERKQQLLRLLEKKHPKWFLVSELAIVMKVVPSTINNYLNDLMDDGKVEKKWSQFYRAVRRKK